MKPIENVTYWRDASLPGVEACRVRQSKHVFPSHVHENIYAIGLMEAGASYVLGPQCTDSYLESGRIALINPAQLHSGGPATDTAITYRMLYVDAAVMADAAGDLREQTGITPEFQHVVVHSPKLRCRLLRLGRLLAGSGRRLEKESAMLEILGGILATYGGLRRLPTVLHADQAVMRRAKEYLAADLGRKVSLESVAGAVGLSRYHFLRMFKKATGMPPHAFRTQRRIDLAKRLLRQGMPFAEVALLSGFSDQSHFTNKFRQFTSATPKQYCARMPV